LNDPETSSPSADTASDEERAAPPPAPGNKRRKSSKSLVRELLETLLLTLILFGVTRFSVQNYQVEGTSMLPTLQNNERILVDKVSYMIHFPSRGDIVVFKYPLDTTRNFIKRVIGIPGDRIAIMPYHGVYHVFVNGKMLYEPYIAQAPDSPYPTSCANPKTCVPQVVPANSLFVMGDNRNNSYDSRAWGFVPMKDMIGRAMISYWPISHLAFLPSQFSYASSQK
jgi:signal peptidase I